MKKYLVLKKIGDYNASVIREFEEQSDAAKYCELMQNSEDSPYIAYYVASLMF